MNKLKVAAAVLALCGAGLAQEGGGNKGGEGGKAAPKAASLNFSQIDANGDGQISKAEWLAFFTKLDANKDGVISADEAAGLAAPAPANGGEGAGKRKGAEGEGKKTTKGDGK